MISAKKLLKLARKLQKLAEIKRKRITLLRTKGIAETRSCSTSSVREKGHFVVYSADKQRFLLPLEYLNNEMMRELFNMAEEEFGSQSNGPTSLPCDAELMEYAIALIKQHVTRDMKNAFLISISSSCHSLYFSLQHQISSHPQYPVSIF